MSTKGFILFSLRLFFYFSVLILILIHPGISISFDRIGIVQWFIIVPFMAVIAFLKEGKNLENSFKLNLRSRFFIVLLFLVTLSILAGGFNLSAFGPFFAGLICFLFTFLLFHYPRFAKFTVIEPFFLAWIPLRLLVLSRSGEEIAGQSLALTQFILVWTAVVFLFHCVVIYFCLYPKSSTGAGREAALFSFAAFAALILVLIVLPPDFVRNAIIKNLLSERMPKMIGDDSERGIQENSRGRNEGRRTLPRGNGGDGRRPGLRGVSEHRWMNMTERGRGGGSGDNRQYLVMVVASDREPVYMGNSFRGQLDPVHGFQVSPEEQLNRLVNQRFFVTWFSHEFEFDIGRQRQEVFSLSTLQQKYLPWRPVSIDPTILNEDSGPLRYIHQVVSNTHFGDPLRLVNVPSRDFYDFERSAFSPYLLIPLETEDIKVFSEWLDNALRNWEKNRLSIIRNDSYLWDIFSVRGGNLEPVNEYLETILAILLRFSDYQYNLSFDDDGSIYELKEFLFNSFEGDCVEFSNSLALLGRLAGIPSRVVTGYLAAEGLQTTAHLRGLDALRKEIPALQQFPFDNLFMVTNMHGHSWTQFYIPGYGWLDFEATSFAIPPAGSGDFNTWDVVIPLLDEERVFSAVRKFPWRAVLRAVCILAVFALVFAYVLRYGRELVLYLGTRHGGRAAAHSLYLLLLARLAADGKPVKPVSRTALEYSSEFTDAGLFPVTGDIPSAVNVHLKNFALLYSELRWREFKDDAIREERFGLLKKEYEKILETTRRKGAFNCLIRIFSLRGLAYL
ncbi:MAG: hypothetical protein LBI12_06625 [Treponema sp.]|nr:hypothetical protein [Treponema sp.]